jgi:signal transduction histidine kinase
MASMLLHTDTLLTADLTTEEARNSLTHLHEQCRWLERLSQKLLKLVTLEHEIQVQPENISELFDDVSFSTADTLRERNTPLITKCDTETETMAMDYDLMKSLIINLIDNASKASEPGQEIKLRAHGNIIEVSDSGSGIAKEDAARVTDAFYMADRSRSKKTGGAGLGLALAKRIADAHGAELVIESEPGAGTTVSVVFALTNC